MNSLAFITQSHLNDELAELIIKDLIRTVNNRVIGHCLQVTDLPIDLINTACVQLRNSVPSCEAYVLTNVLTQPWQITSTKLIERRNANESVIVLFLPPELRTSAEDSFDISTFERFTVGDIYKTLRMSLLDRVPDDLRRIVEQAIVYSGCKDEVSISKYLLEILNSGATKESLGLAIFHLGLIPDPSIQDDTTILLPKLNRNFQSVATLATPDRSIFEKIQNLHVHESTAQAVYRFFSEVNTFEPYRWLPLILQTKNGETLRFDLWEFRESLTGDVALIEITDYGTNRQNEDGYPLVDVQQDKKLKISWETTPPPLQCQELSYFTVEIVKDDIPVTEAKTVKVGKSQNKTRSTTLTNLHTLDLEDGLYYLRVGAWAAGGVLLQTAESDSIFFKGGFEEEDDEEQTTTSRRQAQTPVSSVYEALIRTQINLANKGKSLNDIRKTEVSWITPKRRTGGRYTDQFIIKYTPSDQYVLSVNTILRRIETYTLADADCLGRWELDLSKPLTADVEPVLQPFEGIDYGVLDAFLLKRQDLFQKILNQPDNPNVHFLVETTDLSQFDEEISEYAQAYLDVLVTIYHQLEQPQSEEAGWKLLHANRQLLSIDNVRLRLPDGQTAYLVAPTHPLKMLWGLQFARLTQHWLANIEDTHDVQQAGWGQFSDFIPKITSLNLPHTFTTSDNIILVNVDNFGSFWSIYVPMNSQDIRALVGRIKSLLGSPEADEKFTTISGIDLAHKVQRYLAQHPYITTLRLNAIQPGSGAILVDMLLDLQRRVPNLRYELHIFSTDQHREELGAALDELMSPLEKRSGREELDAFLTASRNSLYPKLVYSKHLLNDLLSFPDQFESHITLLFDAFPVSVYVGEPIEGTRSNYMYGLIHEYSEQFSSDNGEILWKRQIVPALGRDLDETLPIHQLLTQIYWLYNKFSAVIATDGAYTDNIPTIFLSLEAGGKNLISQVHQISDWVFTIDRNFGLEYLDSPYDEYCPIYLIDYQPEYLSEVGHRLIVSTQHVTEVERIVQPVLQQLELPSNPEETNIIINALRSVSGRLVLKLLSSPQMTRGALSMALARLFLRQAGLLQDMVLIPLDSHSDLFSTAKRDADRLGRELSLSRTDMVLVELEPDTKTVSFHLIEVKLRQHGGIASNLVLKEQIEAQLENTLETLRVLYDPTYTLPDRFDRLVVTKELSTLLRFYLERASRYQLIASHQANAIRVFINHLEDGYSVNFSRSGIIVGLDYDGYHSEKDGSTVFHYLGIDKVRDLIRLAFEAEGHQTKVVVDKSYSTTRGTFTRRPVGQDLKDYVADLDDEPEFGNQTDTFESDVNEHDASPHTEDKVTEDHDSYSQRLDCDVILGAKHPTPQYGILGLAAGRRIGLDLNGTNAISLFGVQGSGKSYTLGSILEMAVMQIPGINQLPKPLAAVVFHYSKTEDYPPEFLSMAYPNLKEADSLAGGYSASPQGLTDIVVLVPEGKLEERRAEFPNYKVLPIGFDTSELDIEDWKFLMGVVGNDAMYVKKINQLLRRYRSSLSLETIFQGVAGARLSDAQLDLAKTRLEFAGDYIRDGHFLSHHVRPGRLIIVDLRDELIEKDEALGLFMVMLKIFADSRYNGETFNKLMVFDEAHKYLNTSFIDEVAGVIREMRHKGTSVLIASQDPPSVPLPIIELSSQIILHQFSSPAWLKHIQKGSTALASLGAGRLNMLDKGQAYVWSREATTNEFEARAVKIDIRPRVTRHGGSTVTAVDED